MKKFGFTLIELMVVIGIVGIIMTFSTVNLLSLRNKSSLNSTVTQVIADIRQQQMKAMIGNSSAPGYYGVHFDGNTYTLFHGTSTTSFPTENFLITLEQDLSFSPTQDIIFKPGCGEIVNIPLPPTTCGDTTGTIPTLTISISSSGENKTLKFNQFGVIKEVTN